MRVIFIFVLFFIFSNYGYSQSYHFRVSASDIDKATGYRGCRSGCMPPESRMDIKVKCANGLEYPLNVSTEVYGGALNLQLRSAIWEVLVPSKPLSVLITGVYIEDSQYPEEELYCISRDDETTISVSNSNITTYDFEYDECLIADISIESRPLNTLNAGVSPICYLDTIDLTTSDDLDNSFYNWVYRRPGESNWNTITKFNGNTSIDVTLADFNGYNTNEIIEIAVNYEPGIFSNSTTISFVGCSPGLVGTPQTTNTTCFDSNDGSVTLTFDDNVDTANGYQMRYIVYEGDYPIDPTDEELKKKNPTFPGTTKQTIADPFVELNPVGGGNYKGKLEGLDGGNENGGNSATYFIVYQEVMYDGLNVTVKSGKITPQFTINRPSQVEISVDNIIQPQCTGETGEVTLSASGGQEFESGTYQFSNNGGTTWQTNPTFSNLAQGQTYTFSVQHVLADGECISSTTEQVSIDEVLNSISIDSDSGWQH
ncbi:hypothetical protein HPE56_04155 [Maribacter sp. ANRC-HE7]|uniref:SprB repeat-containing protein n=1 Tax=Maribacter aquimaris TaxID=2737171 RepID=A0ABR7UX56_9FLAO|nr:hypothetical protein [Maribacter aquimaris]MBD0776978.1 hypothetical protein [Maribacter aquimaris]